MVYIVWLLTHCGTMAAYGDKALVNIASDNGVLIHNTNTLPEAITLKPKI